VRIVGILASVLILAGCSGQAVESGDASSAPLTQTSSASVAPSPTTSEPATPTASPSSDLDLSVAKSMASIVSDTADPLKVIVKETKDLDAEGGFAAADPTAVLAAVEEIKPYVKEGLALGNLGNADLDKRWGGFMGTLDKSIAALDKAYKPGNEYGEVDYLVANLGLIFYISEVGDFIDEVREAANL